MKHNERKINLESKQRTKIDKAKQRKIGRQNKKLFFLKNNVFVEYAPNFSHNVTHASYTSFCPFVYPTYLPHPHSGILFSILHIIEGQCDYNCDCGLKNKS